MTETIWKFPLTMSSLLEPIAFAEMPEGARVLSVGQSGLEVVVWAGVYPSAPRVRREFYLAPTGQNLPASLLHRKLIGRLEVSVPSGPLIFHVFDMGENHG